MPIESAIAVGPPLPFFIASETPLPINNPTLMRFLEYSIL